MPGKNISIIDMVRANPRELARYVAFGAVAMAATYGAFVAIALFKGVL